MTILKRREFITLALAASVCSPRVAAAQERERVRRVGMFLSLPLNDPFAVSRITGLKNRLAELGWIEGRNIQYDMRSSNSDPAVRPALIKELIALKPDLLLTSSTPDTAAILNETRTIPVVFTTAADPVGSGFVQSLARPGGNATGLTNSHASMGGKWLEILKELAPKIERVGVLFNPHTAPRKGDYFLGPLKELASSFGVALSAAHIMDAETIVSRVASFAGEPAGGLIVTPDSFTVTHRKAITAAAAQYRVPAIYPYRYSIVDGGLISYGFTEDASSPEASELVVSKAAYVDLILRGANPAELPVRSPRFYELLINLKAAKALGLTVPPALLARADRVFE